MASRPYILVYEDPLLTYLLVFVPSILTLRYIGDEYGEFLLIHLSTIGDPILKPWFFRVSRRLYLPKPMKNEGFSPKTMGYKLGVSPAH